jgi:hypothetical protein
MYRRDKNKEITKWQCRELNKHGNDTEKKTLWSHILNLLCVCVLLYALHSNSYTSLVNLKRTLGKNI